jgi:hypothetical protein
MSLIIPHASASILHQFRREPQPTKERAETTLALGTEQQIAPQYIPTARMLRGWAMAAMGQAEQGAAEAHEGLADFQTTAMNTRIPRFSPRPRFGLVAGSAVWPPWLKPARSSNGAANGVGRPRFID